MRAFLGKIVGAGLVIAAAFCLALVPAPKTEAQHCSNRTVVGGGYNYNTYQKPVVIKEVIKEYVPVAIPTAYPLVAVPVYSYVNAPGYIPGATYGSVMQPQQTGGIDADKIADLVMQKLEKRLKLTPEVPMSSDGDGPPTIKGASKTGAKTEFLTKAVGLLQTKCASCHSGSAISGGGLSLFDAGKQPKAMSAETRIAVYDAVYEGRMPKGGTAMSDQDVELVRLWMRQK